MKNKSVVQYALKLQLNESEEIIMDKEIITRVSKEDYRELKAIAHIHNLSIVEMVQEILKNCIDDNALVNTCAGREEKEPTTFLDYILMELPANKRLIALAELENYMYMFIEVHNNFKEINCKAFSGKIEELKKLYQERMDNKKEYYIEPLYYEYAAGRNGRECQDFDAAMKDIRLYFGDIVLSCYKD